jgi:hypothetical protein
MAQAEEKKGPRTDKEREDVGCTMCSNKRRKSNKTNGCEKQIIVHNEKHEKLVGTEDIPLDGQSQRVKGTNRKKNEINQKKKNIIVNPTSFVLRRVF